MDSTHASGASSLAEEDSPTGSGSGPVDERDAWYVLYNSCRRIAGALKVGRVADAELAADEVLRRMGEERYVWPLTRSILRGVRTTRDLLRENRVDEATVLVEDFVLAALQPTGDNWMPEA